MLESQSQTAKLPRGPAQSRARRGEQGSQGLPDGACSSCPPTRPGAHLGGAHSVVPAPPPRHAVSPGSPGNESTREGSQFPGCALRHPRPQPALRPRLTCTRCSGKSPQWPPSSPRNQPRAGPLHTSWTTSPGAKLSSPSFCARYPAKTSTSVDGNAAQKGPFGQRKSRVVVYRFLLPFPHLCVEEPPQTLYTYPWLAGRPPEPDKEGSAIQPAAEYWAGVSWDELRV